MVVSITAHAGQDIDISDAVATESAFDQPVQKTPLPIISASYEVGSSADLASVPDEIEPNATLKPNHTGAPKINSADKSDPFVTLRPGFQSKDRADFVASLAKGGVAGWSADSHSPGAATDARRPVIVYGDGAAPALPLDLVLNTESPRASDSKLTDAPALPLLTASILGAVEFGRPNPVKPRYAALIDAKDSVRQMRCLAEAIYFEARSEPEAGQAAVAQVVLNRVRSGIFPTDVCGVVYQDANHPFACQFSFACEGKSLRVEEPAAWATATRIAKDVVDGTAYDPKLVEAINYHATYVYPFWAPTLVRVEKLGMHIFYTMRPGLYWAPGALNGHGDLPPTQAEIQAATLKTARR